MSAKKILDAVPELLTPDELERMFISREFDGFFERVYTVRLEGRDDPLQGRPRHLRVWKGREILFGIDAQEGGDPWRKL